MKIKMSRNIKTTPYNNKDANYIAYSSQSKNEPIIFEHAASSNYPTVEDDYIETITFEQDNVDRLYNNPVLYSDKQLGITSAPNEDTSSTLPSFWGIPRLCLFLFPAFTIEFCRVFSAMFMVVDIVMHVRVQLVPLVSGGLIGLTVTLCTAKLFRNDVNLSKIKAMKYFCLFHATLFFGTTLIMGPSWDDIYSFEDHFPLLPLSKSNESSHIGGSKNVSYYFAHKIIEKTPLVNKILVTIGYIFLSSATGSGQYFILCLANHVVPERSRKLTTIITVVLTAIGACTAGFVGCIDMASNWCPADVCPFHVIAQAAVISSVAIGLLVFGLVCSFLAYYYDVIAHTCREMCRRHRGGNDDDEIWTDHGRRSMRTAQEIFDECTALLRDHETSFSASQNTLLDNNDNTAGIPADDLPQGHASRDISYKVYPHRIMAAPHEPSLRKLLKNKSFLAAVLKFVLLTSASMTFQFYSTSYLSHVIPVSNVTGVRIQRSSDRKDLTDFEAPIDVRDVYGLKMNGLAFFLCNGLFIILYLKHTAISEFIKIEWREWTIPVSMLVVGLFAVIAGALSGIIVIVPFLLVACVASLARVVEAKLIHTVAAQAVRTWPPVVSRLTDSASTLLWSLVPVCLVLSSALQTAFYDVTELSATPMYMTGIFTLLAAVTFSISRTSLI